MSFEKSTAPCKRGKFGGLEYDEYDDHIEIIRCNTTGAKMKIPAKINNLPVTVINSLAFQNVWGIIFQEEATVVIPDTVATIEKAAFINCYKLKTAIIGNGVNEIKDSAFSGCNRMKHLTIGKSVKTIGKDAFKDCCLLEYVIIPQNTEFIDDNAFLNCNSLNSVAILNPECSIGNFNPKFNGTIYGFRNSTAETYADMYDLAFVDIDEEILKTYENSNYSSEEIINAIHEIEEKKTGVINLPLK